MPIKEKDIGKASPVPRVRDALRGGARKVLWRECNMLWLEENVIKKLVSDAKKVGRFQQKRHIRRIADVSNP